MSKSSKGCPMEKKEMPMKEMPKGKGPKNMPPWMTKKKGAK